MKQFLLSLPVFLFICTACYTDHQQIEQTFKGIRSSAEIGDYQTLTYLFSEDSHHYLNTIIEAAKANDLQRIEDLGNHHNRLFMTMRNFQELKMTLAVDSTALDSLTSKDLIPYIALMGHGIFQRGNGLNVTLQGSAAVTGDEADVMVLVPNGDELAFTSTYSFSREDGRWTLDYPSSLEIPEQLLKQAHRKSGMSKWDFIADFMENTPEQLEFKYRKY